MRGRTGRQQAGNFGYARSKIGQVVAQLRREPDHIAEGLPELLFQRPDCDLPPVGCGIEPGTRQPARQPVGAI